MESKKVNNYKIFDKNGNLYKVGILLGSGKYADCYSVTDSSNQTFACKVIDKSNLKDYILDNLNEEVNILSSLNHTNIVKLEHSYQDDNFLYIILEHCSNNSLEEWIDHRKRLTEIEARYVFVELLNILEYLQINKVVHRDLKLANILLDQNLNIKLSDFGFATKLKHINDKMRLICFTPNYVAPEVMYSTESGYNYKCDIWSIGIILYTLVIGTPPFDSNDVNVIFSKAKVANVIFPADIKVSEELKDLIITILNPNPDFRPNVQKIKSHAWLKNFTPIELTNSCLNRPYNEEDEIEAYNQFHENSNNTNGNTSLSNLSKHPIVEAMSTNINQLFNNIVNNNSTKGLDNIISYKPIVPIFIRQGAFHKGKSILAYELSDNTKSVLFKDNSTFSCNPATSGYRYIFNDSKSTKITESLELLAYKTKIFCILYEYMAKTLISPIPLIPFSYSHKLLYVEKYDHINDTDIFILSSKVIQMNFKDGNKIVLNEYGSIFTFIRANGSISTFNSAMFLASCCDLFQTETPLEVLDIFAYFELANDLLIAILNK